MPRSGLTCSRMAFILHGPCHGHSHSLSHPHSHSLKSIKKHKHTPMINDIYQTSEEEFSRNNNLAISAQNMNGRGRSDSICSYRSPGHSRTNSFSKKITSHEGRNSFDQQKHRHSRDAVNHDCDVSAFAVDEHTSEFSKKNINIKASVIHVLGDFIQSIGVFVAALVIRIYPNAKIADPICTFVFSIIVIFTTVRIMRESLIVLLDAVTNNIKLSELNAELCRIDGVCSLHHLNVWSISTTYHVMSAHVLIDAHVNAEDVLYSASKLARKKYGIKIQQYKLNVKLMLTIRTKLCALFLLFCKLVFLVE